MFAVGDGELHDPVEETHQETREVGVECGDGALKVLAPRELIDVFLDHLLKKKSEVELCYFTG